MLLKLYIICMYSKHFTIIMIVILVAPLHAVVKVVAGNYIMYM